MINAKLRRPALSVHHHITKMVMVTVIAVLVGMGLGQARIYAETQSNVYVPGAGNVGTAGTWGWSSGGNLFAYGGSTSSVTLSYQGANIRIWHVGPLLQDSDAKDWYNSYGGVTDTVSSSGYGDKAATNSGFFQSGGANYYTSYPDNSASCYAFWNNGSSC